MTRKSQNQPKNLTLVTGLPTFPAGLPKNLRPKPAKKANFLAEPAKMTKSKKNKN